MSRRLALLLRAETDQAVLVAAFHRRAGWSFGSGGVFAPGAGARAQDAQAVGGDDLTLPTAAGGLLVWRQRFLTGRARTRA